MTEITPIDDENVYEFPSYREIGVVLVEITALLDPPSMYRFELEVHEYTGSAFWISEGEGFDYWFDAHFTHSDFPELGFYVIEGIQGTYYRGDWGFTDDEVEWEYSGIRPARPDEIPVNSLEG